MEDRCMLAVDSGIATAVLDIGPQTQDDWIGQYAEVAEITTAETVPETTALEAALDQIDLALDAMLGGETSEDSNYYATVHSLDQSEFYRSLSRTYSLSSTVDVLELHTNYARVGISDGKPHNGPPIPVLQYSDGTAYVLTDTHIPPHPNYTISGDNDYWTKTFTGTSDFGWTWQKPDHYPVTNYDAERQFVFTAYDDYGGSLSLPVKVVFAPEFISDADAPVRTELANNDYYAAKLEGRQANDTVTMITSSIEVEHERPLRYCFDDETLVNGFFKINPNTGEISLTRDITETEATRLYALPIMVIETEKPCNYYNTWYLSDTAMVYVNYWVDLDVDSDNNNLLERSTLEETYEMSSPGKIIYYHQDSDNTPYAPATITATTLPTNTWVRLDYDSEKIAVWYLDGTDYTKWESGQLRSFSAYGISSMLVFIEALNYTDANESVIVCTQSLLTGQTVAKDTIKVTNAIFSMDHTTTNFHPEYIEYDEDEQALMWDCNLNQGVYVTPDNGGTQAGPYLVTHDTFGDGFVMEFTYEFVRRDNQYGYVQAQATSLLNPDGSYKKKLSFVGNSGVKLGGPNGYEIAILDTKAMVDMVSFTEAGTTYSGLNAFEYREFRNSNGDIYLTTGIHDNGSVEIPGYLPEQLNTLMNGVGYGKVYENKNNNGNVIGGMSDYITASGTTGSWQKYYNTLVKNYNNCGLSNHMKIIWTPNDGTPDVGTIEVYLNGSSTYYYKDNTVSIVDAKLYVQSHWGSGVKFSDVKLNGLN